MLLISTQQFVFSQNYEANWLSVDQRATPQWFTDAKFGIFIHWGLYSVPAWAPTGKSINTFDKYAEWYWFRIGNSYDKEVKDSTQIQNLFQGHHKRVWGEQFKYPDFASLWKAEFFDPEQWARIIKNSGAKYVVLTSKHHDGFALWPSKQSWNWNSVDVGPHRDICASVTKAVKAQGLHMGLYYSLYEWYNPLYQSNFSKYVDDYMLPQLKDLVVRYQPDIVWTDGAWDHSSEEWKSTDFLAWLYNESPVKSTVVVNDRWGKETRSKHGDFFTTEYDHGHDRADSLKYHAWEECRGVGGSFGYNQNENLEDYQTPEALIHTLIQKVAAGGNLLLNVGPTASGQIPVIMQQRLSEIGDWLKINGEAIYETGIWDSNSLNSTNPNLYFTSKPNTVYIITTKWLTDEITLEGVTDVVAAELLGYKGKIKFKERNNQFSIIPPTIHPQLLKTNYAWVYKLSLKK